MHTLWKVDVDCYDRALMRVQCPEAIHCVNNMFQAFGSCLRGRVGMDSSLRRCPGAAVRRP